jgi:hypothetical protein
MQVKADAAFKKDPLLGELASLEITLDALESRKEELSKKIKNVNEKRYNFEI